MARFVGSFLIPGMGYLFIMVMSMIVVTEGVAVIVFVIMQMGMMMFRQVMQQIVPYLKDATAHH